jgi:hypothetical protein
MDERPEERRRRGPLDEGETGETTRRVSPEGDADRTQRIPRGDADEERTRVIRSGDEESHTRPYSARGYLEAAEERHARLRDLYGGVDWLASFVGWIVAGVVLGFLSLIASVVLIPLGFTLDIGAEDLGATTITGLIIIGVLLFAGYFAGGYVAGRMARFDGGRNGAMVVVWGLLVSIVLGAAAAFLPGELFGAVQQFVAGTVVPAVGGLAGTGFVGLGILVGVLAVSLLGGFLGGRAGSNFHTRIDYTT